MNEAVYRSPKWLRNIADFEVNTGDDIKGAPSKRKQKKLDEEEKARLEEERLRKWNERLRKEEEEIRQKEEEKRKKEEEENKKGDEFDLYFKITMLYIHKFYKLCQISVPKDNFLTIEKKDLQFEGMSDFEFKVTLDNTVKIPKFSVYIKVNNKIYDYTTTGLNYAEFKMFLINEVFFYHKHNKSDQSKSDRKNPYTGGYYSDDNFSDDEKYKRNKRDEYEKSKNGNFDWDKANDDYEKYKRKYDYNDTKQKNSTKSKPKESDEIANKRRRYNLLKDVLEGHERKLKVCLFWETKNPGKVHPDTIVTKNEIAATKSKINQMNKTYQFESVYYMKHLKSILS